MSERDEFPLNHPGLQELTTSSAFFLLRDETKPSFNLAGDDDSTFYLKDSDSVSEDCFGSLESHSDESEAAAVDEAKNSSPFPRPSSLKFVRSMPDTYTFKRAFRRAPVSRGEGLFRLSECHESTSETANHSQRDTIKRSSPLESSDVYGSVPNFVTTQSISSLSLKSLSSKSGASSSLVVLDDHCWNSPVIECRKIIGCWRALRRFGIGRSSSLNYETRYANSIRSKYQGLRNTLSQVKVRLDGAVVLLSVCFCCTMCAYKYCHFSLRLY